MENKVYNRIAEMRKEASSTGAWDIVGSFSVYVGSWWSVSCELVYVMDIVNHPALVEHV